jgi:glucose-1-phosphate cytidylyltransferase
MEQIGEHPILWHVLHGLSAQGFGEFVIALGSRGEMIKDYFLNFRSRSSDVTVGLGTGVEEIHEGPLPRWTVHLTQTGASTETGGRLKRAAARWIAPGETFLATYGDTLSDLDLRALVAFHRSHGRLLTITAVRPAARFGALALDGDRVERFVEKPQAGEGWILGGTYVVETAALEAVAGDQTSWETEAIEALARAGQVRAYRHEGFSLALDTPRDKKRLEELWASGRAPWKLWEE